jgi:hypothetical protein
MAEAPPPILPYELLKLLLQVAWSDGSVTPAETAFLVEHARRWELPEADVVALERACTAVARLPPPNLGFLRAHRDEALRLVRELAALDGGVVLDEQEVLDVTAALLGEG